MNVALIPLVAAALTALLAFFGWSIRTQIQMKTDLAVVKKEVLPNSGTSLRDALHRVETDVAVLKSHAKIANT